MGAAEGPDLDVLSAEWFASVLGCKVRSAERVGPSLGMARSVERWRIDGDGPSSVMVKRPACAREVRVYRELDGLPGPRCWHAADGVVVLEDLGAVEPGHRLDGATETEAFALLEAVERWHAAVRPAGWPTKELPGAAAHQARFRRGWAGLDRDLFPADAQVVEAAIDGLPDALGQLAASTQALIHCDLHVENVLFDGLRPVVLDWQNAAIGPTAIDRAGVLTCVAPAVLEARWAELAGAGSDAQRGALAWQAAWAVPWLAEQALQAPRPLPVSQAHWARLSTALALAWG